MNVFEENYSLSLDKVEYIGELILKLQNLYSKNEIDKSFFDKAIELLNLEKEDVHLKTVQDEREYYLSLIKDCSELKPLAKISDMISSSLKYNIENKGLFIEEINTKFIELIYDEEVNQDFEFEQDLRALLDSKSCVLYDKNKKTGDYFLDDDLKNSYNTRNYKEMSPEEKKLYFEIEKRGIEMKLIEADKIYQLDNLYNRIYFEDMADELKEYLRVSFTRNFKRVFDKSEIYKILQAKARVVNLDKSNIVSNELNPLKNIVKNTYNCFTEEYIDILGSIIELPKYQMPLKEKFSQIHDIVKSVVDIDEHRFFRSTLTIPDDMKFNDKLKKVKKHYGGFNGEEIFIIFDNTLFKTGENGFIITDKNIYFKNDNKPYQTINIDDVEEILLKGSCLNINEHLINCNIIQKDYLDAFGKVVLIVLYIIQSLMENIDNKEKVVKEISEFLS